MVAPKNRENRWAAARGATAGATVTLWSNIPPRDVLALGTAEDVRRSVIEAFCSVEDKGRIVLSCGGGTPPDVPTENIEALCAAAAAG